MVIRIGSEDKKGLFSVGKVTNSAFVKRLGRNYEVSKREGMSKKPS